jgi:hypothetical protein
MGYLKNKHNIGLVFGPTNPDIDMGDSPKYDWTKFYGDAKELMPADMPPPLGKDVDLRIGGPVEKMSFFQMAPGSILSIQIPSNRSQYELYEVWFNKIDLIHTYEAAKVDFFLPFFSIFKNGGYSFLRRNRYICTQGPQTPVPTWYKPHYYDMVEPETTFEWIILPSSIYIKCLRTSWCNGWPYGCFFTSSKT